MMGHESIVRYLVEIGEDPGQARTDGNSPLLLVPVDNGPVQGVLSAAIYLSQELQNFARRGDAKKVWKYHRMGANMVLDGRHAADIAQGAGHKVLASQMREIWTKSRVAKGYRRWHNLQQAHRVRWMILRERMRGLGLEAVLELALQDIGGGKEGEMWDWLLLGEHKLGLIPDGPFSVVMEYWCE